MVRITLHGEHTMFKFGIYRFVPSIQTTLVGFLWFLGVLVVLIGLIAGA
jgi:hypothetical protein